MSDGPSSTPPPDRAKIRLWRGVVPNGNGGWCVLIVQFAIPQGSTFTAAVRLAGDGIDTYATINSTSQVLNP